MKKVTTLLLLAAAILTGCSNPPSNENIARQKLLGEWQMTSYTATDLRNEQTREVAIDPSDSIWMFTKDSIYQHFDRLYTATHYVLVKEQSGLILHRDMGEIEVYLKPFRVVSLTDKELILQTVDTWSEQDYDNDFISVRYVFRRYSYNHDPLAHDAEWARQMMFGYWMATDGSMAVSDSPGEWSYKEWNNIDSIRLYSYAEWKIDNEYIFFEPRAVTADVRWFPYEVSVCENGYKLTAPGLFDFDPEAVGNGMEYVLGKKSPVLVHHIGEYAMSWDYWTGWDGERYTIYYSINYKKQPLSYLPD